MNNSRTASATGAPAMSDTLNFNTVERQYDNNGGLVLFQWRCTDCDSYGEALPTSWSANKRKSLHRKQTGHKRAKVITARTDVTSVVPTAVAAPSAVIAVSDNGSRALVRVDA